jgi:hypothetical protein
LQASNIRSKVKANPAEDALRKSGLKWSATFEPKTAEAGPEAWRSHSRERIRIRKQGFDVLLMLEATIGLNEVEQQPAAALEPSNAETNQDGNETFTAQDLNFLKSLRIAVEGDEE